MLSVVCRGVGALAKKNMEISQWIISLRLTRAMGLWTCPVD
jgi:hypothetical protein